MSGGFDANTRRKAVKMQSMSIPSLTGGGLTAVDLPKAGLLSHLLVYVTAVIAGTPTGANAYGVANLIQRVTVDLNSGGKLFDVSGAGYHWVVRDFLGAYKSPWAWSTARNAVAAGTFIMPMLIPCALNPRDPLGMIMLQNLRTIGQLQIQWGTPTDLATSGMTITSASAECAAVLFEVPESPEDYPNLAYLHQIYEQNVAVNVATDFRFNWPTGGAVVGMYHLLPSGFTNDKLVVQETNTYEDLSHTLHAVNYSMTTENDPTLSGALTGLDKRIIHDYLGSEGLGAFDNYGRDAIETLGASSIYDLITAPTQTMKTITRWIRPVNQNQAAA